MNTLKDRWVKLAWSLASLPEDLYSGCRKIHRNKVLYLGKLDNSLQLSDAGYTKSKMTMLTKNYLHEESQRMAVDLWKLRMQKRKYGSVSFTTFNHFVKGKGTLSEILAKKSKRASTFGPCIQSVCLTWVSKDLVAVDIFYRTTEWFKKFPADLVFLRDVLLKPFDFGKMDVNVTGHFANITAHAMYLITVLPHVGDPIKELEKLRKEDKFFWEWTLKWGGRYLCDEYKRGIEKFSQAMRVRSDALDRLDKSKIKALQGYIRTNHPGYRGDNKDEDDEE